MNYNENIQTPNKLESYSFNTVAKQSNGSVLLKSDDTVILATVVIDENTHADEDFLPLTVQYIEKSYAMGKFPGGFIKRESKPSDFETLTSRIVDRSIRPLFPKGFTNPVQITLMVLSASSDSDLQVLALNAASAALYVSDIDINTSVSAIRVAKIDDEIIYNPTLSQLANSTLDLYLAGTSEDLLMIEMQSLSSTDMMTLEKSNNALPEDEMVEILDNAHTILKEINRTYEECFAPYAKATNPLTLHISAINEQMVEFLTSNYSDKLHSAINEMAKTERSNALRTIRKEIIANNADWDEEELKKAIESVKRTMVREQILTEQKRADSRGLKDVRAISIETNLLPNAHASALFTRGQTQALVVLTLGGIKDAQMYENLTDTKTQNETFMVHYNFPGFSVGEASPIQPPRRRELGHGNLAKRALESSIISDDKTIRIVSEILESNGSSSMATVCGGYMALRAGDIAMCEPIAGVAMGMVSENNRYAILTDIMGLEDHDGDLDFKVAGSKNGITALQMDMKLGGIDINILKEALYQAKEARSHIIDIMIESESHIILNEGTLPTNHIFNIDPSFIGDVIGQAGKTIREIIEKFDVAIDIDKKSGAVKLTGTSKNMILDAKDHIESIINSSRSREKITYNIGDIYTGKVKKIVDFGAFIELPDGTDGLLHISRISDTKLNSLKEGDEVDVEIVEFKGNKIGLAIAK